MKKLSILLVLCLIFTCGLSAFAWDFCFWKKKQPANVEKTSPKATTDFEILPTMDTVSNAKNQVWVGTFQLIWNDLMTEIVKHPVEFVNKKSVMADNLNKKSFTTDDLNESSYYKKLGLASKDMKKEIEKAIKEKFNETSDILDKFDWTPAPEKYFLYAKIYLWEAVKFIKYILIFIMLNPKVKPLSAS